MAQPTPYVRQFDFVDFQTDNPSDPLPASSVEQELDAVKTTLDQTLANIAIIQRDDGNLANNSVTTQQLASDVLTLLTLNGTNIRGEWVTATAYAVDDVVVDSGSTYLCATAHTSGTFATDLAAFKWVLIAAYVDPNVTLPAGTVGTTELADTAVTAAKLASDAVTTAKILDANVTAAKLATDAVTTVKITDANVTAAKLASDAVTTAKILDANVTTAKIADANVTWGKLAAGIFNQTAVAPALGDKLPGADASDSGNAKVFLISDVVALATGKLVQRVYDEERTYSNNTGYTFVPSDDTKPEITEGVEILSAAITPTSASNRIRVRAIVPVGLNAGISGLLSIHRGGQALASTWQYGNAAQYAFTCSVEFEETSPGTSPVTYSVRFSAVGGATGFEIGARGSEGARKFGGAVCASLIVEEIVP